jgi:predicted ribosome quality control (RQC) complex YloA/Tae2 family protein
MRFLGSFDSIVLAAVAAELEPLAGARLQRAIQPAADEIVLHLRRPAGTAAVLCSIHPRWARVHLVPAAAGSGTGGPFALLLRSRLEHARLRAVRQPPFERILELAFETDAGAVELIAELMARHSNVILVQEGVIAGALRTVPPERSAVHPVQAGLPYRRPPAARPRPSDLTAARLRALLAASAAPVARRLNEALLGISPAMARELCARAGVDPETPAADADADRLYGAIAALVTLVEQRAFAPVVYRQDGRVCGYAPFPFAHLADQAAEPAATMSEAVARAVLPASTTEALAAQRTALAAAVRTALAKAERAAREVRQALEEAAAGARLREHGNLLLAYASQIPAGAAAATVPGFDGTPVTIPLDPALTPVANARRLFARYAKLRRAQPALAERLRRLEASRAYLESALTMIEQALDDDDLRALRAELAAEGYVPRRRGRAGEPAPRPRAFVLPGGASVLVGRTNQENDRLTFAIAGPEDLWFHARGVPGAHVVLRTGGRAARNEEIAQAAAIAAWFSRARTAGAAEVDCTPRKYVRKPRGAPPGYVVYERERTLRVVPALPGGARGAPR